jgi:quinol monooxygenase YgiN
MRVIVVSGYMRVRDGDVERLAGVISNQTYAAQALDGCDLYNFAVDVFDPNLLWISERWRDSEAEAAHMVGDHMVEFNIGMRRAQIVEASIWAYDPDGSVRRLIEVNTDNKQPRRETMIIVMGHAKLGAGEIDRLKEDMAIQVAATQAEDGCDLYCFARDVSNPDTLIISERWRDQAALDAHFASPHMATFNAVIGAAKLLDISVKAYENGEVRTLIGQ